jgi:hypothetical protein
MGRQASTLKDRNNTDTKVDTEAAIQTDRETDKDTARFFFW